MQETRYAVVDGEKIPVLLSDETRLSWRQRLPGGPLLAYGEKTHRGMSGARRTH